MHAFFELIEMTTVKIYKPDEEDFGSSLEQFVEEVIPFYE